MKTLAVLAALLASQPAAADWVFNQPEDPFADAPMNVAMSIDNSGYAAGFRCTGPSDLEMVFITPEKVSSTLGINALKPSIALVVDATPKLALPAVAVASNDGSKLLFVTSGADAMAAYVTAVAAKKRFALGVQMLTEIIHRNVFNVRGSTKVLKTLKDNCKLP